jgi:hypothetical protein
VRLYDLRRNTLRHDLGEDGIGAPQHTLEPQVNGIP